MVNTHFAQKIGLLGFIALTTLPAWGEAAESEASGEPDTQRAACDAKCREDYQSNAAALQACLRDCGAIGPATAGAISAGHEATHTVQQAGPATRPPAPAEAVNLNSSKSNRFSNQAVPGTGGATPVQTTTVKGSKSNSDNRSAVPLPTTPVEASNLKLSKSNINREAETEASGATSPPVESANLNLSKSNINAESAADPSGAGDQSTEEGTINSTGSDALKSEGVPATGATPSEEPEDDAPADR